MGNASSSSASAAAAAAPSTTPASDPQSACPVIGSNAGNDAAAASALLAAAAAAASSPSASTSPACPVKDADQYRHPHIYNVYGQRVDANQGNAAPADPAAAAAASVAARVGRAALVDPRNRMPLEPNQEPCPGQRRPLETGREASTIPKGGTAATWVYPSPQMFFNALRRKGKGGDVNEEQMSAVVRAHNAMNEASWHRVEAWEALHCDSCPNPTLLRFLGRPHDLSPLARARALLGGPEPFDRHDWVVDRCGTEVRYVIDFYHHEERSGTPQGAFEIVARPAIDSAGALVDRARMAVYVGFARLGLPCPVTGGGGDLGQRALEAMGATTTAAAAATGAARGAQE